MKTNLLIICSLLISACTVVNNEYYQVYPETETTTVKETVQVPVAAAEEKTASQPVTQPTVTAPVVAPVPEPIVKTEVVTKEVIKEVPKYIRVSCGEVRLPNLTKSPSLPIDKLKQVDPKDYLQMDKIIIGYISDLRKINDQNIELAKKAIRQHKLKCKMTRDRNK